MTACICVGVSIDKFYAFLIFDSPSISLAFCFLRSLTDFIRVTSSQELNIRLNELPAFINEAAPFGSPRDTDCDSILAKLSDKSSSIPKSQKQPAWKPVLHTGKSSIYLSVSECIQAVQCEHEDVKDVWEVYGTITCKAELEGATPDVTLNISHLNEGIVAPLDHLVIHPCVQSADSHIIPKDNKIVRPTPRRVRFIPPSDSFTLCHYTVCSIQELPIFGVYHMKCDQKSAKISVTLQLSDQVKNSFEYAELQLPFFNRGIISIVDSNPSQGSLLVSPDRRILVWNIGQKFPSKSLDASLTANIQFTDTGTNANLSEAECFCTAQNAYCQLYFKINDFTYSGCYIDTKSLQVSPNTKFKLTINREFLSKTYKIWNSYGGVLTTGK
ncbi:AP-5 complex subunit mu-1 [Patella vulgata]|uniref:AP-5 complex subunit mu-1 n=1 Tax=Patella vulgata TaxID=6465 RepID=UPI0021806D92|nr:AP-5 complex subunit mu-1 [Patella vulgata]